MTMVVGVRGVRGVRRLHVEYKGMQGQASDPCCRPLSECRRRVRGGATATRKMGTASGCCYKARPGARGRRRDEESRITRWRAKPRVPDAGGQIARGDQRIVRAPSARNKQTEVRQSRDGSRGHPQCGGQGTDGRMASSWRRRVGDLAICSRPAYLGRPRNGQHIVWRAK